MLLSLAAEIPDGLLYGLLPVSFAMVVGLMAWIVRELSRVSEHSAVLSERLERAGERLEHAETRLERTENRLERLEDRTAWGRA